MYNQTENEFSNDCTLFTLYQLLSLQWWLTVKYSLIDRTIDLALKAKVLFKWWAVFETIYNWFVSRLSDKIDLRMAVQKLNLYKPDFKELYHKEIYYWIWLKRWNQEYINAVKKWRITKDDIDDIISYKKKWFNHNMLFGKWEIHEIYLGKTCNISYDVFMYGIQKWVFGSIWRTIIPDSMFARKVSKQLRNLKWNPNYTANFTKLQKIAFDKAKKIRANYNWQ